ncbi:MAG: acyl carrier protein [Alphaproteobacteria bacterium]|nr:acyl carrier protein [Alphaproteobacteria bacterium]
MSGSEAQARAVLAEVFDLELDDIADDASIETLAAWNSLAHMRLILELERRLGHELAPETVVEIASLDDVAALLASAGADPGA